MASPEEAAVAIGPERVSRKFREMAILSRLAIFRAPAKRMPILNTDVDRIRWGFRATICRVKEVETLRQLLRGEPSEAYNKLMKGLFETEKVVATAIRHL